MILHRLQGLCTTMPGMVFSAAPQLAQSLREGVAAAPSFFFFFFIILKLQESFRSLCWRRAISMSAITTQHPLVSVGQLMLLMGVVLLRVVCQ